MPLVSRCHVFVGQRIFGMPLPLIFPKQPLRIKISLRDKSSETRSKLALLASFFSRVVVVVAAFLPPMDNPPIQHILIEARLCDIGKMTRMLIFCLSCECKCSGASLDYL